MITSRNIRRVLRASAFALAIPLMGISINAFAQASGDVARQTCTVIGARSSEAAGDREGHLVVTSSYVCKVRGGALDGGVTTGTGVWEQDNGVLKVLFNDGITRRAGGMAVFSTTEGKQTLDMKDGKVIGWQASGKSVFVMASGNASAASGKTFTWSSSPTGLYEFIIDIRMD